MLVEVYCDGASRGQGTADPGEAACAVVIYKNSKPVGQMARGLGRRTNNEAEYEAVLLAILMCWAADLQDPIIYSDSQLVVKQVNGHWQCKAPALVPLLMTIQDISEVFRFRLQQNSRKTPGIQIADGLAKSFLDSFQERMKTTEEEIVDGKAETKRPVKKSKHHHPESKHPGQTDNKV